MDDQTQFFKDQVNFIHHALKEREERFENLLLEERGRNYLLVRCSRNEQETRDRQRDFEQFLHNHAVRVTDFDDAKERLVRMHTARRAELAAHCMQELLQLELDFERSFIELMDQYAPPCSEVVANVEDANGM